MRRRSERTKLEEGWVGREVKCDGVTASTNVSGRAKQREVECEGVTGRAGEARGGRGRRGGRGEER